MAPIASTINSCALYIIASINVSAVDLSGCELESCTLHVKQVEDEVLRQQIEQYNETVSRYQQYHHQQQQQHLHLQHYQHEQQQQGELFDAQRRRQSASAPADVVQALLDISTLPSSSVHVPSCQTRPSH